MFWGGGGDAVFYSEVNTAGIDNPSGPINITTSTSPQKIDQGKWQTKLGSTAAYRSTNQWIVTTSKNGDISIASNDQFDFRANLTKQAAAKSAATCGVCLVPGFFGRTNNEEWAVVVVYRGFGADSKLYEVSIGRTKAQYEILIDTLQAQVADLDAKRAQAVKEAKENKDAKDALQLQLTQVQGQRDQALKDALAQKSASDALAAQVATLTKTANDAVQAIQATSGHITQLRDILSRIKSSCDHSVSAHLLLVSNILQASCVVPPLAPYNQAIASGTYSGWTAL
jgi:hypothetical protein